MLNIDIWIVTSKKQSTSSGYLVTKILGGELGNDRCGAKPFLLGQLGEYHFVSLDKSRITGTNAEPMDVTDTEIPQGEPKADDNDISVGNAEVNSNIAEGELELASEIAGVDSEITEGELESASEEAGVDFEIAGDEPISVSEVAGVDSEIAGGEPESASEEAGVDSEIAGGEPNSVSEVAGVDSGIAEGESDAGVDSEIMEDEPNAMPVGDSSDQPGIGEPASGMHTAEFVHLACKPFFLN